MLKHCSFSHKPRPSWSHNTDHLRNAIASFSMQFGEITHIIKSLPLSNVTSHINTQYQCYMYEIRKNEHTFNHKREEHQWNSHPRLHHNTAIFDRMWAPETCIDGGLLVLDWVKEKMYWFWRVGSQCIFPVCATKHTNSSKSPFVKRLQNEPT